MLAQSKYAPGHYPPANLAIPRLGDAKVTRYFKKLDELSSKAQGPLAPLIQRKQPLTDLHTARAEATMPMAQVYRGSERWHDAEEGQATSTHEAPQSPRSEAQSLPSYTQPPQSEVENLPVPTSPPTELGPRPAIADRMGAACEQPPLVSGL